MCAYVSAACAILSSARCAARRSAVDSAANASSSAPWSPMVARCAHRRSSEAARRALAGQRRSRSSPIGASPTSTLGKSMVYMNAPLKGRVERKARRVDKAELPRHEHGGAPHGRQIALNELLFVHCHCAHSGAARAPYRDSLHSVRRDAKGTARRRDALRHLRRLCTPDALGKQRRQSRAVDALVAPCVGGARSSTRSRCPSRASGRSPCTARAKPRVPRNDERQHQHGTSSTFDARHSAFAHRRRSSCASPRFSHCSRVRPTGNAARP